MTNDQLDYDAAHAEAVDRLDVISTMECYGGGFVSRLASAWRFADQDNDKRLREAFPELWKTYEKMARKQ